MPATPPIAGVSTSLAAFVGLSGTGPLNTAIHVAGFAEYQATFGPLTTTSELGFAVYQFFLNGGSACYIVRVDALTPQTLAAAAAALGEVPILNLLAIPGVTDPQTLAAAAIYCESRRGFLIIDSDPTANTPALLVSSMRNHARLANAAVYGPWLKIPDPLTAGATRIVAPSGSMAGLYARNDSSKGVWNAPAGPGAQIDSVQAPAFSISDAQDDALSALGFNAIRQFPSLGIVVWGARTLASDSDWTYVPIRRFAIYLEQSIAAGLQWAVFEPNAEPLWAQVLEIVNAFLLHLFQQGALAGSTADEAFFVKCDATTMTHAEIAGGVLNIVVGFAPLWPAEFVDIKIQQWAGKP